MKLYYIFLFVALHHCAFAHLDTSDIRGVGCQDSIPNQGSNMNVNYPAPVQNFFITNAPCNNEAAPEIPCDYTLVPGVGGIKLHLENKSWNDARKACLEEGAHLAIITSKAENDIINAWRKQHAIGNFLGVWLGFQNLYNAKDWVSVLDEPLSSSYVGWTTLIKNLPDNSGGHQHCTRLIDKGMDDIECGTHYPFVCKIKSSATKKACKCPS